MDAVAIPSLIRHAPSVVLPRAAITSVPRSRPRFSLISLSSSHRPGLFSLHPRTCCPPSILQSNARGQRRHFFALCASNEETTGSSKDGGQMQKLEVAYNPQQKIEDFAKEFDPTGVQRPSSLTLFSPSKVNVFLRVTHKRPDGYHELASLFHAISLGDTIKFSISPSSHKDSLTTNAFGVPLDDSNLIIKALNLFRRETGINNYFWVHLDKRVPTGAGLGGGSGNAATALWAANRMSGNVVGEKELLEMAAEIGSDISFFFSSGAAFCTGRGEIVEDVRGILPLSIPLCLMKPQDACATADVYRKFKLENASKENPRELLERIRKEGITQATCINDLEPPAFEVLPSLKRFKQRVASAGRNKFSAVFMSGSGSSIVGVGNAEAPAFLYEEDEFADVFISDAYFILRDAGEWYSAQQAGVIESAFEDKEDVLAAGKVATGISKLDELRLPFSYEA